MKKVISMLVALSMLLCMSAAATAEAAYTPGTYTATAAGFGGDVTVTVTVDESAITDVKVEGEDETPAIGGVAVANMPAAILAAGGSDVDATTGATVTSTAILTALDAALAQARGTDLAAKMAPGTYTAQAYGFQQISPITVTVTVDETSIQDIEFDGNLDSVAMIRAVNTYLLPRIVENQSVGVDAITGATATSNAVLTAARDCLEQALVAGGSSAAAITSFLTPEPKVEAQKTIDVDVLVVGMGAAGISAATAAAEAQQAAGVSVSVLAIEKSGRYGGTGAFTGEPMSVNPPRYKLQYNGGEDYMDYDDLLAAWTEYVEGDAKMEVVETFLQNSGETADWLYYDHGFLLNNPTSGFGANTYRCKQQYVSIATAEEGRDYGMDVSAGQNTMVDQYYQRFVSDYVKLGGQYMLETEGYELIYDEASNRVTGVKAKGHDGTDYTINAKSVILCTGRLCRQRGDGEGVPVPEPLFRSFRRRAVDHDRHARKRRQDASGGHRHRRGHLQHLRGPDDSLRHLQHRHSRLPRLYLCEGRSQLCPCAVVRLGADLVAQRASQRADPVQRHPLGGRRRRAL